MDDFMILKKLTEQCILILIPELEVFGDRLKPMKPASMAGIASYVV